MKAVVSDQRVRLVGIVVLAGGKAKRLDGQDKAQVVAAGRPLWSWLAAALDHVGLSSVPAVIVTPTIGDIPAATFAQTCEDPPRSGPAAGVLAGVAYLSGGADTDEPDASGTAASPRVDADPGRTRDQPRHDYYAILPVDAPLSGLVLPQLIDHAASVTDSRTAVMARADGRLQCVIGLLPASYTATLAPTDYLNTSMYRLLDAYQIEEVPVDSRWIKDADTLADLSQLEAILGDQHVLAATGKCHSDDA